MAHIQPDGRKHQRHTKGFTRLTQILAKLLHYCQIKVQSFYTYYKF